jgi:hypothetical protein
MKLLYNIPRDWTIAITGGTALTDVDAWADPNPGERVRIQWPSGTQTTGATVGVQFTRSQSVVPVGGGLRGLRGIPAGTKVVVTGKRAADAGFAYALGGNSATARTVALPGGDVGITWAFDAGLDAIIGAQVLIYNDVNGSASIAAEASIEIGTPVVGGGIDFVIQADWTLDGKDPSISSRTLGSQLNRVLRPGYRVLTCTPAYVKTEEEARGGGLSDGSDWQTVGAALRRDPYVLAIARVDSSDEIQRTSIFGAVTRLPAVQHLDGALYQPSQLVVEEIPGST